MGNYKAELTALKMLGGVFGIMDLGPVKYFLSIELLDLEEGHQEEDYCMKHGHLQIEAYTDEIGLE
ncbi:hypothetical protein CR513_40014, partial [Mucuna pruriens]